MASRLCIDSYRMASAGAVACSWFRHCNSGRMARAASISSRLCRDGCGMGRAAAVARGILWYCDGGDAACAACMTSCMRRYRSAGIVSAAHMAGAADMSSRLCRDSCRMASAAAVAAAGSMLRHCFRCGMARAAGSMLRHCCGCRMARAAHSMLRHCCGCRMARAASMSGRLGRCNSTGMVSAAYMAGAADMDTTASRVFCHDSACGVRGASSMTGASNI